MIGTDFRGKFNFKVATINQFLPFGSIFDVQWRIKTKNTNMRFDNCFSGCLRSFMLVIVLEHSSIIRLSTDIYIILQAHDLVTIFGVLLITTLYFLLFCSLVY